MIVTPLRAVVAGLLALFASPFVVPTPSRGQAPAPANTLAAGHGAIFDDCYRCHNFGPTARDVASGASKFLRLKESAIWQDDDLHAKAVDSLKGDLGKRMGDLLYHDPDVTKQPDCLACHAVDLTLSQGGAAAGHGKNMGDFFRESGVSCEACHGIATQGNGEKEWLREHRQQSWRKVTPAEKKAKGLMDMRNPIVRAERCAACHVGNTGEGKFVTHAMYAAGHPPLPPLETLTFSRDQPTHAIPPDKNKYIAEDVSADDAWKLFHVRKDESANARQAAAGAAIGFREAMKTLATAADEAKDGRMLDFAHFDCAACHHDLIAPSWRQERGFAGTPGRPLPRTGPTTLLRTVAGPESSGFDARFAALVKACDAKPFGDPAAIGPAARELAAWSDGIARKLDDAHYDVAKTSQLRRNLADVAHGKPCQAGRGLDYDDAQQLLWAFMSLDDEGTPVPTEVAEALAKLAGPEPDKPMFGRLWEPGKWEPGNRPLIATLLPDRLRKASQYRPETFREAFDKIAAGLK
jgi:hypothetical protein